MPIGKTITIELTQAHIDRAEALRYSSGEPLSNRCPVALAFKARGYKGWATSNVFRGFIFGKEHRFSLSPEAGIIISSFDNHKEIIPQTFTATETEI